MSPRPNMAEIAAKQGEAIDSRYHPSAAVRRQLNKVFPTHWSFLLGEIAMYSFIVLLLTGVWLTLFFDPSMQEVTYNGVYQPARRRDVAGVRDRARHQLRDPRRAVRPSGPPLGGAAVRGIDHGAPGPHLLHRRVPPTPRGQLGDRLAAADPGDVRGFFGYSLPDDLLSGTGIRAALSGITMGIPIVGTWMHWALFGGDFPGEILIPRLYALHILLIPGIILALIGVHLALVWFQKHTQFPGPGRTETNVVGVRVMPVFAVKSGAFFAVTVGVLGLMGGLLQINPIWVLGPYKPSQVSAGSQPDFYMMWTDGLIRLWPAWEFYPFGHTIPQRVGGGRHGPGVHAADRLPVPGEEVLRRRRSPQPVAASA